MRKRHIVNKEKMSPNKFELFCIFDITRKLNFEKQEMNIELKVQCFRFFSYSALFFPHFLSFD
jgi:hypothetical protein